VDRVYAISLLSGVPVSHVLVELWAMAKVVPVLIKVGGGA
jgi:hypothetical protein